MLKLHLKEPNYLIMKLIDFKLRLKRLLQESVRNYRQKKLRRYFTS